MRTKEMPVGELRFGMYIAQLDRPWTETPFMFQGFCLQTEQQLAALRRLCRHVFVDVARSAATRSPATPAGPAAAPAAPAFGIHGSTQYSAQRDLEREMAISRALYLQAFAALEELLQPLEKGSTALDGREVQRLVSALADSVVRNPDALLLASKRRPTEAPAHARALQVAAYMMAFGRFLQREREEIALLGLLGFLQDVGKARLPRALLECPGPLAPEASELLKRHVELSAHVLGVTSGLPPKLPALALLHHERQDGRGYPRGLKGYQIGLYGSIAAICDAYDALLAPPPYGEGRSPSDAVKALLEQRGSAFHGPLLEQFVRCLGAFPVGSVVELSSGEAAVVIAENGLQRLKPKVWVLAKRTVIDLAGEAQLRIRRTLGEGKAAFDPTAFSFS